MAILPGARVFSNPRGHDYLVRNAYRSWIQDPVPPPPPLRLRHRYGIPKGHELRINATAQRSWTWVNNTALLVAKDDIGLRHYWNIPDGHQDRQINAYRAWVVSLNNTTLGTVAAPFNQKDWPLPKAYPPQHQQRTWTWNYNLNLIGQDRLPFNQEDWPNPRDHKRGPPSWAAWYNLNLEGQDRLPTGAIFDELPQRPYPPQHQQRTWTWSYNLNLVGRDVLPTGEHVYERTPRAHLEPYRFWAWSYNLNLIAQDQLPTGLIIDELAPRDYKRGPPSWAVWYNLNLIGQDELPTGERHTDRPPPVAWFREWYQNLVLTTLSTVQRPFNQFNWPNPKDYLRSPPNWAAWYNLNLIGQDQLPIGLIVDEIAPRDYKRSPPSWAWWYNLNLIAQDQLPVGLDYTERPRPVLWYRDWSQNLQQSTLSVVFRPFNQFDWPLPIRSTLPVAPSWSWWYNLNLVAQDQFPAGEIFSDRPPPVSWLRDWSQNLLLTTLFTQPVAPFNQLDWPNPRDYLRQTPYWTIWYNLNLIVPDVVQPPDRPPPPPEGGGVWPWPRKKPVWSWRDHYPSPDSWIRKHRLVRTLDDIERSLAAVYERIAENELIAPPETIEHAEGLGDLLFELVVTPPADQKEALRRARQLRDLKQQAEEAELLFNNNAAAFMLLLN